ncbi:hypothetical protein BV25DRAFT_1818814 [Artomyces pyxidatus]|uniref:Uncharacterized protein n=1 Tax=Artomyces pyxidatus TaxID=48021 RepID=A0ACB8TIW7_9AGAM|nr:hypothetical protein BV25DRAFT_1818814 [Artomyces pyxidatus]
MSLSMILNDDPAPRTTPSGPPASALASHSPLARDPPPVERRPPPSRTPSPLPHRARRHSQTDRSPRDYAFRPVSYQPVGGWDAKAGEWVQGEGPPSGYYHPDRLSPPASHSPNGYQVGPPGEITFVKDGVQDTSQSPPKKRRRNADDDSDYHPPGTRRHGPRRHPPRTRQLRTQSPSAEAAESDIAEERYELTEEDRRLASSDLSDCEEIWTGELGEYMLDTRKRRKLVEDYFERTLMERNSGLMRILSHRYAEAIERIPMPPPPPPPRQYQEPPQSVEDDLLSTLRVPSPGAEPHSNPEYGYENGDSPARRPHHPEMNGAEDAARELEESILGPARSSKVKGKGKEVKRPASRAPSDASSSDFDVPMSRGSKRRKLEQDPSDITADLVRSIADDQRSVVEVPDVVQRVTPAVKGKGKGKAKAVIQREQSMDSLTATPKGRKKPGPRRKLDAIPPQTQEHLGIGSTAGSVAGDITPAGSRPASPTLTATSATVFEIDEAIPPLKKAKKVDDTTMLKRVKALEEAQKKVWKTIARREVAKVYKYHAMGFTQRQAQLKRIATLASIQARRPYSRTPKAAKDVQAKSKRLMREMLVFWKKNEKEERDVRKREQKEAVDRAKVEEEKRETARQARKLEFLISQTELYSHFVGNKLKTAEVEGDGAPVDVPIGASLEDTDPTTLLDLDFDDADHTNLHRHARHNAQEAVALARKRAQAFDTQAALERKTNEALQLAKSQAHLRDPEDVQTGSSTTPLVDLDSDELNFQNPTSLSGPLTIAQPRMLMAQLKEYQLKGLNWLATLYEQGINGILADEMGLGKTVQSISLLAYLAETHDIWGPFLVVAPASTLHNWQQELTRFVPNLKALPYWGNVKDRATLRKFWSRKEISYNQDTPFHVLITSYQLVTQDQQYFQRVKWQYMILDEAQNIKNAASVRWKTLLSFQCRNRLLLTGTPIQNSMQELWALLHFIMPSLFDSHDEFNEWFSKDIENAAENKGSKLNEHQLRRLHMILKPFMLRRVKRHVQNELSDKIEKDIYVDLSARQRAMYKALQAKVSVQDLLEKAANIGDADSARSLMNLVMQFRKVCNHPELFERADIVAPFSFANFGRSGPINREGDFIMVPYSTRNPIEYAVPQLLYLDGGLLNIPREDLASSRRSDSILNRLMNIWTTDWIQQSLNSDAQSAFSFLPFLNLSAGEAHALHTSPLIRRSLLALAVESRRLDSDRYSLDSEFVASAIGNSFQIALPAFSLPSTELDDLPALRSIGTSAWADSRLSRPGLDWFIPSVVAPPISIYCPDRTFMEHEANLLEAPLESLALYGLPPTLREVAGTAVEYDHLIPNIPYGGLVARSSSDQLPRPIMQVPEAKSLIYDSAKLARLDALLQELKAGDHRVLIYFQMTRMMDLMEEYLIYRQYKYLRLDGSSKLEDRRDMVMDWQTRPDIFIFILSTRAGGLGINLTAADTVVFYDHDWNPSNDAQAMDRAHRLGQTRQVTVYRLITKGTIDERIVQLARVKKDVQDIVVGNKNFTDVTKPSEIVQLLLNEDQLASLDASKGVSEKAQGKRPARGDGEEDQARDLWQEEGDEFFGHNGLATPNEAADQQGDDGTPIPSSGRGKRRKGGNTGSTRGRKPGPAKGSTRRKSALASGDGTPLS